MQDDDDVSLFHHLARAFRIAKEEGLEWSFLAPGSLT